MIAAREPQRLEAEVDRLRTLRPSVGQERLSQQSCLSLFFRGSSQDFQNELPEAPAVPAVSSLLMSSCNFCSHQPCSGGGGGGGD